jgi:hypothetical protein
MSKIVSWTLGFVLLTSTAWAGSIGDPPPANPCPGGSVFRAKLAVLDVTSDGDILCRGFTFADTAITCTVKEPDREGAGADVVIEYFDEQGEKMNSPFLGVGIDTFCGVAPGSALMFTLSPLPPSFPSAAGPWSAGTSPTPGYVPLIKDGSTCAAPGCILHGYARILSTDKKIQCTGTRIDLTAFCSPPVPSLPPIPLTTKNLTVIKNPQKGD